MTLQSSSPFTLSSLSEASISYPQNLIRRLVTAGSSLIQQHSRTLPIIEDLSATSLAALFLTVFAGLLAIIAMSWQNPFSFWRRSPSYTQPASPHVRDSDFSYLTSDDIVDPPRTHHHPQYIERRPHTTLASSDDNDPDILLLKHRGVTYPLHFRPYAIDDGALTIGEIRRRAAEKTGTSDLQRIKILYKGKLLRDDAVPCKDEGLKQQSEIMCVVSEVRPGESTSDFSVSENDKSEAVNLDSNDHVVRPDENRKPKKDKRSKRKKKREQTQRSPDTSTDGGLAPPTDHRPTSSGRSSANPSPSPSLRNFRTGNDQVDALLSYLRSELAPMCEEYIAQPPADSKSREFEHKRLSETILAQVILKADGIDSEDARTARRALIKEAQSLLNRIDEVAHRSES